MTNTADRIKFDNEMKKLAEGAYKGNEKSVPKDWINFAADDNPETGFHAEAFFKNDTIVISFRGTNDTKDINEDKKMYFSKKLPNQYIDAQKFYNKIKKDFPTMDIVFTGHSLGGSLAQLMGNLTGCETVTFNAYGVADLLQGNIKEYLNIRNYGNENDTVFNTNRDNLLGDVYMIAEDKNANYVTTTYAGENNSGKCPIKYHFISTMGDLEDAVPYKSRRLQGEVSMDIDYKDIDPKRVFTNEEIGKMSKEEYSRLESFILQQMASGDVMPKAKADEKLKYGYLIWVEPYVRTDGTQVSGYYRRR